MNQKPENYDQLVKDLHQLYKEVDKEDSFKARKLDFIPHFEKLQTLVKPQTENQSLEITAKNPLTGHLLILGHIEEAINNFNSEDIDDDLVHDHVLIILIKANMLYGKIIDKIQDVE